MRKLVSLSIIFFLVFVSTMIFFQGDVLGGKKNFIDKYKSNENLCFIKNGFMKYSSPLDIFYTEEISKKNNPDFVQGEIIVKYKQDLPMNIMTFNDKYDIASLDRLSDDNDFPHNSNVYKISFSKESDINTILKEFKNNPNVEYAEPNYIYRAFILPNDTYFDQQWALNQSNDHDIDAPDAWNITTGNENVIVAVIDTGVDWDHPDLADNIWNNTDESIDGSDTDDNGYIDDVRGWDFYNNDSNPMDDNGHGSHCSGIISAVGNNGIGIAGICWNCSIIPIKALNSLGDGYADDLANAIYYAVDNGADVISMSWGGYFESSLITDAINYADNNGVLLVGAAGNDNIDRSPYPAGYDSVIAVAATNQTDSKASFSNWGSWVDLAASGVDIYSTYTGDSYHEGTGTSMACPHVSGLAALLLSNNSSIDSSHIKSMLKSSVDEISSDKYIGTGRINLYQSLLNEDIPNAEINKSILSEDLSGNVAIRGTANGTYFTNYSVLYGDGVYPTTWIEINSSSSEVNDDVLAIWDTSSVEDGVYTIKLLVNGSSNKISYDLSVVIINNYASTLYVGGSGPNNYTGIQEAIYDAGDGDTVFVYNGTYNESVMVDSNIEIIGDNNNTIVIGNSTEGYAFWVDSDRCNISNLNIQNTMIGIVYSSNNNSLIQNNFFNNTLLSIAILSNVTGYSTSPIGLSGSSEGNTIIRNNSLMNYWIGMLVMGNRITIQNNSIYGNMSVGIYYIVGNNNTILYNTFTNDGIAFLSTYFNYSVIENNNFYNNEIGIASGYSRYTQIRNNSINLGDTSGIELAYAYNNTCYNNTITNISGDAFNISYYSDYNTFYSNVMKNNTRNAFDDGSDTWYNQEYSFGNYWDDYNGSDLNNNGIGDAAYYISGSVNQDLYPLYYEPTTPPQFIWVDDRYNSSTPGWNVDRFNNIQNAIDNVSSVGKIYVFNGTYYENITIDKEITLRGENKNTVIINSTKNPVVNIISDNVSISGFTIENSNFTGIKVLSENVTINNNIIRNNPSYGIGLMGVGNVFNNTVEQNTIYNNGYGIAVLNNYNTLENNYVYNNSIGIYLTGVCYCAISDNTIENNDLTLTSCESNTISSNTFKNKTGTHCAYIFDSNNNSFYHNNFLNNLLDAYDDGSNNWSYNSIGNYWDDFDESSEGAYDNNSDGIIDTPYNISGGDNQDLYPLAGPYKQRPYKPTLLSPSDGATGVLTSPTLKVRVTDPNNDTMNVSFYTYGGSLIGTDSNVDNGGIASVTWSGRSYSTSYSWYVIVNDSTYLTKSDTWSFTTKSGGSSPGGTPPSLPGPDDGDETDITNPPTSDPNGPYSALTYQSITFDGSGSTDNGTITNYTWDFGDGNTGFGVKPTHSYGNSGIFVVTLTVTDDSGFTDSNTTTANITLDTDGDGWSDEEEEYYGSNETDFDNVPTDTDNDGTPDLDDEDDDNDGIDDWIEEMIGSNPCNSSDIRKIEINNKYYYLSDSDNDSKFDKLYYEGKITNVGINEDGLYTIDINGDDSWDYIFNPVSDTIIVYSVENPKKDDLPWIPLIVIIVIISIVAILLILYKLGFIRIEEVEE